MEATVDEFIIPETLEMPGNCYIMLLAVAV